jgi:hypothetical protein
MVWRLHKCQNGMTRISGTKSVNVANGIKALKLPSLHKNTIELVVCITGMGVKKITNLSLFFIFKTTFSCHHIFSFLGFKQGSITVPLTSCLTGLN